MFEINEVVVYRQEIFRIIDKKKQGPSQQEVLVLAPYQEQEGLTTRLQIPAEQQDRLLRRLSTPKQIQALIERIPKIPLVEGNNRMIENDYRQLLKKGDLDGWVQIIKTTWVRNHQRIQEHKKSGAIDDKYFHEAERLLYAEIAAVFQCSWKEARERVLTAMQEGEKNRA